MKKTTFLTIPFILLIFISCKKEEVKQNQEDFKFSKTILLTEKNNSNTLLIKCSSDDSTAISLLDENNFLFFTKEDAPKSSNESTDDCNDTSEDSSENEQSSIVSIETIEVNITGEDKSFGITFKQNTLKACKYHTGWNLRFLSGTLKFTAVRIRNESGKLCNALKIQCHQYHVNPPYSLMMKNPYYTGGPNDDELRQRYEMRWRYTQGFIPQSIIVHVWFKNTNFNNNDVSVSFSNNTF
jgi:hypothetical protein